MVPALILVAQLGIGILVHGLIEAYSISSAQVRSDWLTVVNPPALYRQENLYRIAIKVQNIIKYFIVIFFIGIVYGITKSIFLENLIHQFLKDIVLAICFHFRKDLLEFLFKFLINVVFTCAV